MEHAARSHRFATSSVRSCVNSFKGGPKGISLRRSVLLMPSKQGPLAKGLGMLRRLAPPPPAPPAPVRRSTTNTTIHRDAGALSATDGLRDRPQLRLRAEVVVVVEPDKLPSPRKEVGSSPAVTPAARARTPSEPSAARTRSEPSAARDLRSNPAGQPLKKIIGGAPPGASPLLYHT